nr:Chain C, Lateral Signaling Target [Caenorhabditis elegans]7S02_C Chain C, Lateral Signaling Target [Caenorhabditis elegans]
GSNSSTIAYSKSQHEAPKQLLQLRSEIKPLIPLNQP